MSVDTYGFYSVNNFSLGRQTLLVSANKPPKPHKPAHLSIPSTPSFRSTATSCSDISTTLMTSPTPQLQEQRKSEPIILTLSSFAKIEPLKPPMRPPKPLKQLRSPHLSPERTPTLEQSGKKTPSSPYRKRPNYSNFTLGEEIEITDVITSYMFSLVHRFPTFPLLKMLGTADMILHWNLTNLTIVRIRKIVGLERLKCIVD